MNTPYPVALHARGPWVYRMSLRAGLWFVCALVFCSHSGRAVEQMPEFLKGLRQRGYYDSAFDYLEFISQSDLITGEQRALLPYERAVTAIEASRAQRDPAVRTRFLDQAQQALQEFLQGSGDEQFMSAARSQLGNILVERARMNLIESKKADDEETRQQLRQSAKEQFMLAQTAFTELQDDLRERLKSMPAHVSRTQDPELHQQRTEYRQQFLQSLLLGATVLYEKSETVAPDSEERTQWLTEAADAFEKIYQQYRNWLAGRYALLYQARCYQDLGRLDDALSMFNELILQEDDSPSYRRLKTKAFQSAIDCWCSPEQNKYVEAILQGANWFHQMRPNEAASIEWLEFRLSLAHAYVFGAEAVTKDDSGSPQISKYQSSARKHAQAVVKRAGGDLRKQAQEILAMFSGYEQPTVATEDFKNFAEARDAGWEWLQQSQSAEKLAKVLQARAQNVESEAQRAEVEAQRLQAENAIASQRHSSFQAYRAALQLADGSVPEEDLNAVRYYLSFLFYQRGEYYDAIVMSEQVVRHFPESAVARRCAKISLASYVTLLQQAQAQGVTDLSFETAGLEQIAEQIVKKWPDETDSQEALVILINIAIQQGNIDAAEKRLEQIPAESAQRGVAELKTGQALWNKYLRAVQQLRQSENAEAQPESSELERARNELEPLKKRSKKILEKGVDRMKETLASPNLAAASLSLSQIYLESQEPSQAVALLETPSYGSLALAENGKTMANAQSYAENTYKTALRAYISSLSDASDSAETSQLMSKAEKMMEKLERLVGDSQEGRRRLIAIYVSLASDLEQQIRLAPTASRQSLSKGFEAFLLRVVSGSTDPRILSWAAEMFFRLGTGNDSGTGQVAGPAKQYFQRALTTYDKILQLESTAQDRNLLMHLRMRKAVVYRRNGEFDNAMKLFTEILERSNAMIAVQVEAAMTLQEWGDAESPSKYSQAIQGISHSQNARQKTIWGWATIGRKTSDNPKFVDVYFQSRYELAYCHYRLSLAQQSNEERKKMQQRAERDITWTAKFHPELGGERWKSKFDALLQRIRNELTKTKSD